MRIASHVLLVGALAAPAACRPEPTPTRAPTIATTERAAAGADAVVELVESWPVETTLDHPDVRDAADVWPEMLGRARRTLDFAQLYASEADATHLAGSRLTRVLEAIERALGRGVKVRFVADGSFASKYPETLERLARAGAEVRRYDAKATMGGVLHAKYFVVDGEEAFLGSQNFDWRALAHIQELGVRVRARGVVAALSDLFEVDWATAAGERRAHLRLEAARPERARSGEDLVLVASPRGHLASEDQWDLPALVGLLDGARRSVSVQLLTYAAESRDGAPFADLDDALRRAARRGVPVRLLVSHWAERPGSASRRSLEALARAPNVEVRVLAIPPWSGGEIPFARVSHAKYLVVDGERAWLGTSNWEGDYFTKSRNVGVVAARGALPARLARVFDDGWSSAYARPLAAPDALTAAGGAF